MHSALKNSNYHFGQKWTCLFFFSIFSALFFKKWQLGIRIGWLALLIHSMMPKKYLSGITPSVIAGNLLQSMCVPWCCRQRSLQLRGCEHHELWWLCWRSGGWNNVWCRNCSCFHSSESGWSSGLSGRLDHCCVPLCAQSWGDDRKRRLLKVL